MSTTESLGYQFQRYSLRAFDHLTFIWHFITSLILSLLPYAYVEFKQHTPAPNHHPAILITGTSTGIGYHLVQEFLQQGYTVIATVRKQADADRLNNTAPTGSRLHVLFMDMVKLDTIDAAPEAVQTILDTHSIQLVGLINNAGYCLIRPIECVDHAALVNSMETNFLGAAHLTRKMLPFLRASKGRVINITSAADWVIAPWYGSYSAAKAGLWAWSTALRREISEFGVSVSIVEPGSIRTAMLTQMNSDAIHIYEDLKDSQDELIKNVVGFYDPKPLERFFSLGASAPGPEHVYDAVNHALTSRFPKGRYLVGWDARFFALALTLFEERIADIVIANIFARHPWWLKE
jgi:NAD(P)-dependent dehydrogenase (short-subunit alcohol dehydrogenase family)